MHFDTRWLYLRGASTWPLAIRLSNAACQMPRGHLHYITYFTRGHYFSASQRNTDHIHQGLGKIFVRFNLLSSNVFLSRHERMLPPRQCYDARFAIESCLSTVSYRFSSIQTGFLPQHLKFSNAFELSMQAVDKSVTLPYWDFTIDQKNNNHFVFQSDTFGSLSFPSGDTWVSK